MASIAPVCLPAILLGPPLLCAAPLCNGGCTYRRVCARGSAHPLFWLPRGSPVACQLWVLHRASCPYLLKTPKELQLAHTEGQARLAVVQPRAN